MSEVPLHGRPASGRDARPSIRPHLATPTLYRGTSLIRDRRPRGPSSRLMPRALWRSDGGGLFVMSEAPLYPYSHGIHHAVHVAPNPQ